jgi:hypothetical protein
LRSPWRPAVAGGHAAHELLQNVKGLSSKVVGQLGPPVLPLHASALETCTVLLRLHSSQASRGYPVLNRTARNGHVPGDGRHSFTVRHPSQRLGVDLRRVGHTAHTAPPDADADSLERPRALILARRWASVPSLLPPRHTTSGDTG